MTEPQPRRRQEEQLPPRRPRPDLTVQQSRREYDQNFPGLIRRMG